MESRLLKLLVICCVFFLGFSSALSVPIVATSTVVCVPSTWQDITVFLGTNYIAHAGTVPSFPGARWPKSLESAANALLVPFSTLCMSVQQITRHFSSGKGDINAAFACGAAVIVVRLPDDPHERNPKEISQYVSDGKTIPFCRDIHGCISLPKEFALMVPNLEKRVAVLDDLKDGQHIKLSKSQSWVKMGVSVAQLVSSSITLYRTRGHQFNKYGYAAFGLSVFPYAMMSLVNLVCTGIVGEYPSIYVIRTRTMEDAERQFGAFHGAIGTLKEDARPDQSAEKMVNPSRTPVEIRVLASSSLFVAILPHLVIFLLSGYRKNSSTVAQRAWMLAWVCAGQVSFFFQFILGLYKRTNITIALLVSVILVIPAIGGFVQVVKMFKEFGSCSLVR